MKEDWSGKLNVKYESKHMHSKIILLTYTYAHKMAYWIFWHNEIVKEYIYVNDFDFDMGIGFKLIKKSIKS